MTNPLGFAPNISGPESSGGYEILPGLQRILPPLGMVVGPSWLGGGDDDPIMMGPSSHYTCVHDGEVFTDFTLNAISLTWNYDSSVAATLASEWSAAGVEYVTLRVVNTASLLPGYTINCPPVDVAAVVSAMSYVMSGDTLDVYMNNGPIQCSRSGAGADSTTGCNDGVAPQPLLSPWQMYITDGYLLRPTALTWAGQDPDNAANRLIWLASEVAAVTLQGAAICGANVTSAIPGFAAGWEVGGFNPVSVPTSCSIVPLPDPPPPPAVNLGVIRAQPSPGGIVRVGPN